MTVVSTAVGGQSRIVGEVDLSGRGDVLSRKPAKGILERACHPFLGPVPKTTRTLGVDLPGQVSACERSWRVTRF